MNSDTAEIRVHLQVDGTPQAESAFNTVSTSATRMGNAVANAAATANRAASFTRHEWINLGYQLQDVGVSLASGQKPMTVLLQQGSQIASIAMASQVTLGGFFKQLATGAATAAKPVGILGAALATLTAAWQGTKTMLAEIGEGKAIEGLGDRNRVLADSILGQLDSFVRAGRITAERAKDISADIRNAFGDVGLAYGAKLPVGAGGLNASQPKLVADVLVSFSQELRSKLPAQLTQAAVDAHQSAGIARLRAEKEVQDKLREIHLDGLAVAYKAGNIPLEGYLARRRQLATEAHREQIKDIEVQDQDLRLRILKADSDEKKKLAVNAWELKAKREQADADYARELERITAEGIEERNRREEEAAKKRQRIAEDELRAKQQLFSLEMATIGADWRMGSVGRYQAAQGRIDRGLADGTLTGQEAQILRLQQGPNPTSWTEQFTSGIQRMTEAWGTFQQQISGATFNTIQTGIDATANSLAHAAVVTGDWAGALKNIRTTILVELVAAFIRMGAQYLAQHVIMAGVANAWSALTSSLRAKDVAEHTAAESTKLAASLPAATATSISSYGLAAAVGLAAVIAAMAAFGGFKEGGYTGDLSADQVAGVVHGREFVVPADVTAAIGPGNLDAMVQSSRNPVSRASAPNVAAASSAGGSATFIFHDLDAAMDAFMSSPAAEKKLMRMVNGRAVEMGIRRA